MTASVRTRATATAVAGIMTAGGFAAMAIAPANATTGQVTYACSALGQNFDLPVEIDSDAPAKVYVGETANIKVSTMTALPGSLAKQAYDAPVNARFFDGTSKANGAVRMGTGPATAVTVDQSIPETEIPDQATATDVPFTATASAAIPFKPTAVGDLEMTAGDFTATINLKDENKNPALVSSADVTCTAPSGKAPVIDTVVLASKSTTTLKLSQSRAQFGADITATATVATPGGTPDGTVAFTAGGVTTNVAVKNGVAELKLGSLGLGTTTVGATFTPKDAVHYDGSSAAAESVTVGKAEVKTKAKIIGKRVRRLTTTELKVVGINKTVPTGKVKVVLRKKGTKGFVKAKRGRLAKGMRTFKLGKLGKGRFKLVVRYFGDSFHQSGRTVKRFRVRR